MAETVLMPKLGFDMAEGTLVRWVKAEGDQVKKGEVLAEIETDKATVEVESSFSGVVLRHLVNEKDVVPVATPIAVIGEPGEKVEDAAASAPQAAQAPQEGKAPAPASAGETPAAGAEAPAPQAAQAPQEGKAPAPTSAGEPPAAGAGAPAPQAAQAPQAEKAPAPTSAGEPPAAGATAPTAQPAVSAGSDGGRVKASPLARKVATEAQIDLGTLQGSGPGGRIVRKDVEQARSAVKAAPAAPAAQPAPRPLPTLPLAAAAPGEAPADQHVPLDKLRAAIGRRLVESKQQVPHFYVTHEYDMDALLALRKQVNELLPEEQKVSVNDFLVKAAALCLRQFPGINASLAGNEIIRHGHINIGVAVALDNGLLTVVCRDADLKPLRQISQEVKEMVARARSGKVRTDDIEGSTFSISNMGMYEVEHFIAIINPPEAAILAIGSARPVPVVGEDGAIRAATRMKATISADHRVTDGAEAARYMQALAPYLEKPLSLLV